MVVPHPLHRLRKVGGCPNIVEPKPVPGRTIPSVITSLRVRIAPSVNKTEHFKGLVFVLAIKSFSSLVNTALSSIEVTDEYDITAYKLLCICK